MVLLDYAISSTEAYIKDMPKIQRKKYGQFFTSKETAIFMAGLLEIPDNKTVSILDPGAGSGILSVALIERLQSFPSIEKIEVTCYENDSNIIELLSSNLKWACEHSTKEVTFKIITSNYILSQMEDYNSMLGANPNPAKYDLIIGNPPYMKVAKNAPEALTMPDVCNGAPNMYFLFATMSVFNLKENGEMVYIIPRAWTSGAYFRKFREKFLKYIAIEHLHLFVARDKVFDKESVLQETLIIKGKKTHHKPETVNVTTTKGNSDFLKVTWFEVPYSTIISENAGSYVFLVTSEYDAKALYALSRWNDTLPSLGLKMKTGLTVDFRNREALRYENEKNAVPLFYSQHIQDGKVVFPIGKGTEYIVTEQQGLLQENTNYLFVKRFTAKEEKRRLQCGVYLSRKYPEYTQISTQNKLNFISGLKELSECVVYGLYVLFNSTLYDCYYRILDGSTQVNSTEVNTMPVPPIKTIESMGKELIQLKDMSEASCDKILRSYL